MSRTKGISPKLAAAIGPPLTAVVTAMILTNTVDRTSLAALAAIVIGALLGYHAPAGHAKSVDAKPAPKPPAMAPAFSTSASSAQPMWTSNITTTPVNADDGDDSDDQLPGELADTEPHHDPPPDEVDQPEQTQLKAGA